MPATCDGGAAPVPDGPWEHGGRRPECWLRVDVVEAYVHCSEHVPQLVGRSDVERAWGTDDEVRKGGNHFRAKHGTRPWVEAAPAPS